MHLARFWVPGRPYWNVGPGSASRVTCQAGSRPFGPRIASCLTKALWRNIHLEKPRSHGRDGGWSAGARLSTGACRGSDAAPQLHLGVDARAYEKGCGAILLRDGQAGGPSAREGAARGAGGRRAFYLSARTSRRRGGVWWLTGPATLSNVRQ